MITELQLENFRCFESHVIPLRSTSVIVGSNNAGKSTVVEALRLVSIVVNRSSAINFTQVPSWLDIPKSNKGVKPSLKGIEFNADSVFHNLGDPPARLTALFDTGSSVEIYIGHNAAIHAVIKDPDGKPVSTKGQALRLQLPQVSILPQVSPFAREENILNPEYAKRVISSSWASLHFRNQLNLYPEYFDEFKHLSESTWRNLRILGLEGKNELPGKPLMLMLKDHEFVTEVAWMGHGLQMWLQTMWFLGFIKE